MARGIIAKKIGMTQLFDENGKLIPVTVLQAGPCTVVQVKTVESDSYSAVQLGFEPVREKTLTKPELGHFKKNQLEPFRVLKEFRDVEMDLQVGQKVTADVFSAGDRVKVTGLSKGKGYQGVMKRHGFGGGRRTHGSKFHRAPGGIGAATYPARVRKGKKLPGQLGNKTTTTTNLKIFKTDSENNILMIKGSIPGARTTIVKIEAMK